MSAFITFATFHQKMNSKLEFEMFASWCKKFVDIVFMVESLVCKQQTSIFCQIEWKGVHCDSFAKDMQRN